MFTIRFACGAAYRRMKERPPGGRLLVFAVGDNVSPPSYENNQPARCLFACPAKVGESHRKEQVAWIGDKADRPEGEPTRCVLCQPTLVYEETSKPDTKTP